MSKSRSVKQNFEFSSKYLNELPNPEDKLRTSAPTAHHQPLPTSFFSPSSLSNANLSDDVDYQIESYGKTSSSSPSFDEDYYVYDTESTKRVEAEFERMERVLQGLQKIPDNYPKGEYELWIKTFPQLRFIGVKPNPSHQDVSISLKTVQINRLNENSATKKYQIYENLKHSVIDQVLERVNSRLAYSHKTKRRTAEDISSKFDDILTLSSKPLTLSDKRKSKDQEYLGLPIKDKSSRTLKDTSYSSEFSSLPHLPSPSHNRSASFSKSRSSLFKFDKNKTKDVVVSLPPIINNISTGTLSASQYRSISVTPRNGFHSRRGEFGLLATSTQIKRPPHRLQKLNERKRNESVFRNNKDATNL